MNLHNQEKITKNKLGLLNLAQELGSVSKSLLGLESFTKYIS